MREAQALVLEDGPDPSRYEVHGRLYFLGVSEPLRGLVELERIGARHVDIVRLLVYLVRVQLGGQHQRGVHEAAPALR